MSRFYLLFLILLVFSCRGDDESVTVEAELQPYFERFRLAGMERGVTVDFDLIPIAGRVANLFDSNVNGWCSLNEDEPREIIIDDSFWATASDWDKEFILMHELGHCYLNRLHDDAVDGNGNCLSIMHSTTESCIFPYNDDTREAYLDELFSQ